MNVIVTAQNLYFSKSAYVMILTLLVIKSVDVGIHYDYHKNIIHVAVIL